LPVFLHDIVDLVTLESADVSGFTRSSMLTIGRVAAILGVQPDTVRTYEKRGIIPRARRSPINGYRIWEPEDLDRIRQIFLELTYATDDGRQ
jgi:MerR family regulatory protein